MASAKGVDVQYNVVLTQLQEQLHGLMKRGTRAQVAKTHAKLGAHYASGGFVPEAIGQFENELTIRKELRGRPVVTLGHFTSFVIVSSSELVAQESCLNNLGAMHQKAKCPEAAVTWFLQALDLASARENAAPAKCLIQYNLLAGACEPRPRRHGRHRGASAAPRLRARARQQRAPVGL